MPWHHARMDRLTQETLLEWIERDRSARGWTYDELARELQVPVRHIYRWKAGTTRISQENLFRILDVFGWKIERTTSSAPAPSSLRRRAGNRYCPHCRSFHCVCERRAALQSLNGFKSALAGAST